VFAGTITISNLGMFGVAHFDAILPPNQGTILAISSALPRVVQNKQSGFFGVSKFMTVSATCDHRHIYGAHVAEFLKDLAGGYCASVSTLCVLMCSRPCSTAGRECESVDYGIGYQCARTDRVLRT
jgi:hypothetical protein